MRQMMTIPEVRAGSFQWTCKVLVVEKQNPRTSKTTPGKLFRPMLLQDTEGFKVHAMTYGNEIDLFGQTMELHGTYFVSGAVVKPARDASRVPDLRYPNIWTLTRSTLVQPVPQSEAIDVAVLGPVSFTPFSKFYDHLNDNVLIDAVAIVIEKLPRQWIMSDRKQVAAAEFVIVDEECLPVVLTLWESFAAIQGVEIEHELRQGNLPVLHLKSVQCSLFQGIKLGTRYASAFDMASTNERAVALNQWKAANMPLIRNMIASKAHIHSLLKLANPVNKLLYTTSTLPILHDASVMVWLRATIAIPPETNMSFYVGCGFCSGKINTEEGIKHNCMHCGGKNSISILRYKLEVDVTDATGHATTVVFSDEIDKLLSLCDMRIETDTVDMDELATKLAGKTFIVGLKRNTKDELGRSQYEHVLACLDDASKFDLAVEPAPLNGTGWSSPTSSSVVTVPCASLLAEDEQHSGINIPTKPTVIIPAKATKENETQRDITVAPAEDKISTISTPADTALVPMSANQTSAKRKLHFDVSTPIKTADQLRTKPIKQEAQAEKDVVGRQAKQKKLG